MSSDIRLDFDSKDGRQLVVDAYSQAQQFMSPYLSQWKEDYRLFSGFVDMLERDPNKANLFIPKLMAIIRQKLPVEMSALFGQRPYFPFAANEGREDLEEHIKVSQDVVDDQLARAFLWIKANLTALMKLTYGTAYMSHNPVLERVIEQVLVETSLGLQKFEVEAIRVRSMIRSWAPWEVLVDPFTTGFEEKGMSRYAIKRPLVSKREIFRLWEKGKFPHMDIEKLLSKTRVGEAGVSSDFGQEMLSEQGLASPMWDNDIGVMLSYESEDRYIDVFLNGVADDAANGMLLGDGPNPHKHGLINLSRWIHEPDPHTRNQFFGVGEVKIGEVQQAILNDLYNMMFDSHNKINTPTIYHDAEIDADSLVRTVANTVAIDLSDGKPIQNKIFESSGGGLPPDHYALIEKMERNMDMTAAQFEPSRGELSRTKTTATEVIKATEKGDNRNEHNIKLGEEMFLRDFGFKCTENILQHVQADDVVEVVGMDRAARAVLISSQDFPGIWNFDFQGSDRLTKQREEIDKVRFVAENLLGLPNILPGGFAQWALKKIDVPKREYDKFLIPDELMIQIESLARVGQDAEAQAFLEAAHGRSIELNQSRATAGGAGPRTSGANVGQTQPGTGSSVPASPQGPAQLARSNTNRAVNAPVR